MVRARRGRKARYRASEEVKGEGYNYVEPGDYLALQSWELPESHL